MKDSSRGFVPDRVGRSVLDFGALTTQKSRRKNEPGSRSDSVVRKEVVIMHHHWDLKLARERLCKEAK